MLIYDEERLATWTNWDRQIMKQSTTNLFSSCSLFWKRAVKEANWCIGTFPHWPLTLQISAICNPRSLSMVLAIIMNCHSLVSFTKHLIPNKRKIDSIRLLTLKPVIAQNIITCKVSFWTLIPALFYVTVRKMWRKSGSNEQVGQHLRKEKRVNVSDLTKLALQDSFSLKLTYFMLLTLISNSTVECVG